MWPANTNMNNWALQSQEYQNMNHEEVDWALLAKQWIQMKDSSIPVPQIPAVLATADILQAMCPPPPPPLPQTPYEQPRPPGVGDDSTPAVENIGSVDMEIEEDKEAFTQQGHNNDDAWKNWSYNTSEDWENSQVHPNWRYNYIDQSRLGPSAPVAANMHGGHAPKDGSNYWSSQNMASSSGIMMQKVVDYGHRDRKVLQRESFSGNHIKGSDIDIDSNQRKQLPNWIRDGLEKMERERHKLNEEERLKSTHKEMLRKKKEAEEKARSLLQENDDGIPKPPVKSKFDSESDNSDAAEEVPQLSTVGSTVEKHSTEESVFRENEGQGLDEVQTAEEKFTDMMKELKKCMVEVLLDVTTKLISEVCIEAVGKAKMKEQQLKKKSPGLGLYSSGLGLDIYSDSGGEVNSEEEVDPVAEVDSDAELQQTINRKHRDFEAVERDIFLRLQREEESKRGISIVESKQSTTESSSSQDEADQDTEEVPKEKSSNSDDADSPVAASQVGQLSSESVCDSGQSDSKSSSSLANSKNKKQKNKSKSRGDSSDDTRRRKKKKKKNKRQTRSSSRTVRRKSRSRSRNRKSRSRSRKRKSRSRSRKPKSGSRSIKRRSISRSRKRRSRSTSRRRRSRSASRRRKSRSVSVNRRRQIRDSRSRSRLRSEHRMKRSRSCSVTARSRSKRSRRSRSRHSRRSGSRTTYGRRHRSHSRSDNRRARQSRSVEIKERSKRRSRS